MQFIFQMSTEEIPKEEESKEEKKDEVVCCFGCKKEIEIININSLIISCPSNNTIQHWVHSECWLESPSQSRFLLLQSSSSPPPLHPHPHPPLPPRRYLLQHCSDLSRLPLLVD